MDQALQTSAEKREQLASDILHLTVACPVDSCNPPYCPLHDVRKLSPEGRGEWVRFLSNDDLVFFTVHHQICLQARMGGDLRILTKQKMDALAERINQGIAKEDFYIVTPEQLRVALGDVSAMSGDEKCLHLDNFSRYYGFTAQIEDGFTRIIFKRATSLSNYDDRRPIFPLQSRQNKEAPSSTVSKESTSSSPTITQLTPSSYS